MDEIDLESLSLVRYNELYHSDIKSEFLMDKSQPTFIYSVIERLESSSNYKNFSFQSAYMVMSKGVHVGYVYISNTRNDEVFIESYVMKKYRHTGYGKAILNEVCDYLFLNYNIKSVKLDIDPSNQISIRTATSCGFDSDDEDLESRLFKGNMVFIKDSYCYKSKRRKTL